MIHENTFGKLIEKNRRARNISKTKLCRGLCSVTSLSRYEQDVRIPEKILADALLERMGIKPYQYEFILSDEDFYQSMLRKKIIYAVDNGMLQVGKEYVDKYRQTINGNQNLHIQFMLLEEGKIAMKENKMAIAGDKFQQALECTVGKMISDDILFSNTEMELIFYQSEYFYYAGEREQAYKMFEKLKQYMEKIGWDKEKYRSYHSHILYRMAEYAYSSFNTGLAEKMLEQAKNEMLSEFQLNGLYEVFLLLKKVKKKNEKEFTVEEEQFMSALDIIKKGKHGEITEEGLKIWESIINQQL